MIFCSQFKHIFYRLFKILLQIAHWGLVLMHLPESIGYITCKLERALKVEILHLNYLCQMCYITCKLERALKDGHEQKEAEVFELYNL